MSGKQTESKSFFSFPETRPYTELPPILKLLRIFICAGRNFFAERNGRQAVALTYYTLFAIVPLAALLFGIAKGFDLQDNLIAFLTERFANQQEILQMVIRFAQTTLAKAQGGVVAGVGVLALIWTVWLLMYNIETTFNMLWHLPGRRIARKFSDYLAAIIILPLILLLLGSVGVIWKNLPSLLYFVDRSILQGAAAFLIPVVPTVLAIVIFSMIYFAVPNTRVNFLAALCGGIFAGITFMAMQNFFITLQMRISHYNSIYGSFAALPLFLIWLEWSWMLTLFGAELAFVTQYISSGKFARENHPALSHSLRRRCELEIVRMCAKNFAAGNGPLPAAEIGRKLSLWRIELEDFLTELFQSGILVRTEIAPGKNRDLVENTACSPGLPLARLTPVEVLQKLDNNGDFPLTGEDAGSAKPLDECLKELHSAAEKSPANRPLGEL